MTAEGTIPREDRERKRLLALEDRYRNELLGEDERCEIRDRILRLKRRIDTLDAQTYCLERMN